MEQTVPEEQELERPETPRMPELPIPPSTPQLTAPLPIRTPTTAERPRLRRTPSLDSPLPPRTAYELLASTAPLNLGREKRKRVHTKRYNEAKEMGAIVES